MELVQFKFYYHRDCRRTIMSNSRCSLSAGTVTAAHLDVQCQHAYGSSMSLEALGYQ